MDYDIYPFKRYSKYRLYVVFDDQYENEVRRSTGVTYPLDALKKERRAAKKKAATKAKEIVQQYFENNPEPYQENPDKAPRLKAYLKQDYWPYIKANRADSTLVSYRGALNHFLRICKDRQMDQYKRIDLERYKLQRLDEDVCKTTVNIEVRSIKAAFSWANKYDIIAKTPYKGNEFLFDVKPNKRSFTDEEIATFFESTEGENIGLIVRLACFTGMRIGELLQITWDRVHLGDEPHIDVPAEITKTNEPRNIPLSDHKGLPVVHKLQEYLEEKKKEYPKAYEERPDSKIYLIQKTVGWGRYATKSVQDMFRRAMNRAGLPKELTFHCLRHTFATQILGNNGSLYKVSKIMGHSSTLVTERFYDHVDTKNFRDTVNKQ